MNGIDTHHEFYGEQHRIDFEPANMTRLARWFLKWACYLADGHYWHADPDSWGWRCCRCGQEGDIPRGHG